MYRITTFVRFCKCPWKQLLRTYATKTNLKTFGQKKEYYGNLFPNKLLTKKQKTPPAMYLANEETARTINEHLDPFFKQSPCDTILEMNPGTGLFTRKLLDREDQFKKILLMESMDYFMPNLQEMHSLYPERVKVKNADFINVWKILYQDKLDNGLRVPQLLNDVPKKPHSDDPNMILFGIVGSYPFFVHLINSVIFQNSFLNLGRTEMYFVVPPPIFLHLSCSSDLGYMMYRSTTILFQLLFEYRFIACLPRDEFLPTQSAYNNTKGRKLEKVHSINPEDLYLVRIVPRRNLFDYIAAEDLPAFWYFVKQNCISRRNRIIPNLEKWIPGCGPRLIVSSDKLETTKPLYADEDASKLPTYSAQCTTISNRDFYPNINIFTQFGDLKPSQMLTLFTEFRKWPQYNESSFLASFENSMVKTAASAEESVEGIADEDDELEAYVTAFDETENISSKRTKRAKKVKQS